MDMVDVERKKEQEGTAALIEPKPGKLCGFGMWSTLNIEAYGI